MKVLLGWQADGEELALAREVLPDVELRSVPLHDTLTRFDCSHEMLARHVQDAEVLATFTIGPQIYEAAQSLQFLAWLHSGCDPLDFTALARRKTLVANTAGANATAVAEHAFALLLALAKRVVERDARVKNGGWRPFWGEGTSSLLLSGSTVAVVGTGEVGRRIATRARAFEAEVLGIRRSARACAECDTTFAGSELKAALALADFVVLAVPLTEETDGLIGSDELAAMKPGACLVNCGRGRLVDEIALRRALDEGHLAGFASDVWWSYPNHMPEGWHYSVPSRLGIHLREDVIASHDSAVDNLAVKMKTMEIGFKNIEAFLSRSAVPNLVFDGERLVGSLEGLAF